MSSALDKFQGSKFSLRERLAFARSLPTVASQIHGGESTPTYLKRSAKFCANGLRHSEELTSLKQVFDCPELTGVLAHFPSVLEKLFHPYVCADWTLEKRRLSIENHFSLVKEIFGDNSSKIYQPGGYQLFEFVAKTDEIFSLELFPGYQNEGSIGIRLCDSEGGELYSLTFHLENSHGRTITVGALQGPNDRIAERQKVISMLTKSLFGLRPKSLMIEVLFMVAESLAVEKIYGVSSQAHIYQSSFYSDTKRSKMTFDCDQFWAECGATRFSSSFYEFPNSIHRKDFASVKSSKRSQYRKRYAWLDEARIFVAEAMEEVMVPTPTIQLAENFSRAA